MTMLALIFLFFVIWVGVYVTIETIKEIKK